MDLFIKDLTDRLSQFDEDVVLVMYGDHLPALDMTEEQLDKILDVDKDAWEEELKGVEELYAKFGDHLPKELADELATVKANLEK